MDRKFNGKISTKETSAQTYTQPKDYISPAVAAEHNLDIEEYPKFIAFPHSLIALAILCGIVFYFGVYNFYSKGDFELDASQGLIGAIVLGLAYGCFYLPDSLLRRPHPLFWRLITSMNYLYLLLMTFALFQTKEGLIQYLKFFDKDLGVPLPEKNYAMECQVTKSEFPYIDLTNVINKIDFFVSAHLVGWYVKMLIMRDVKMCFFLSFVFELLEITFSNWLPNFKECWWDSIILDVFGMNAMGIWLGYLTCKYMEMKNYKWFGVSIPAENIKDKDSKDYTGRISKFFSYFTPNYYVKHEWNLFLSLKRFLQVVWFWAVMNICDLNHFFLKFVLMLPETHFILHVRIYMCAFLAIHSAREYYEYITNPACKRLGQNIFIAHLILFVEVMISYKFSGNLFDEPFTFNIKLLWTIIFLAFSIVVVHLSIKDTVKYLSTGKEKKSGIKPDTEECPP